MHINEAKTKECPFKDCKCLGDKCMAWSWDTVYTSYANIKIPSKPSGKSTTDGECTRLVRK